MNLLELKRSNSIKIYRAILNGINTLDGLTAATGISKITVSALTRDMCRKNILLIKRPKLDRVGKPQNIYIAAKGYFCYFIDKNPDHFSVIAIDTTGEAIDRFDFKLSYESRTVNSILNDCIVKTIKRRTNYEHCMGIYLLGNDIDKLEPSVPMYKTTKEELIALSLANEDKASLFEFNNEKIIISLYSHLHYPTIDKNTLCKAIDFDEIYSFSGKLYYESFDSLQRIAIKCLENLI